MGILKEVEIKTDDIIDVLRSQRNASMDEIVRMSAIIRAQQRELEAKELRISELCAQIAGANS